MAKRRGHGEGSIYQRADGRWTGSVELGWIDGKRKRKVIYGKTRKAVAEQIRSLQQQIDAGTLRADTQTITVRAYAECWLERLAETRTAGTCATYGYRLRKHIYPVIGQLRIDKVTAQHIRDILSRARTGGASLTTRRQIRDTCSALMASAYRDELIPSNVVGLVAIPSDDSPPFRGQTLTAAQANTLLQAARPDAAVYASLVIALHYGVRRGELHALRWSSIDWTAQTITIDAIVEGGGRSRRLRAGTKGHRRARQRSRVLPLLPIVADALLAHRDALTEQQRLVPPTEDHDLIFPDPHGRTWSHSTFLLHFRALLERAGLPRIRFHDLRHTCATLLLEQGVAPRVVMEILGHANIAITLDLYSHVDVPFQREAVQRLAAVFGYTDGYTDTLQIPDPQRQDQE